VVAEHQTSSVKIERDCFALKNAVEPEVTVVSNVAVEAMEIKTELISEAIDSSHESNDASFYVSNLPALL